MDRAKKAKKSKKTWDIDADLADREQTASAIMNLFNRQAEAAEQVDTSSRRANRQTKWHVETGVSLGGVSGEAASTIKDMDDDDEGGFRDEEVSKRCLPSGTPAARAASLPASLPAGRS